MGARAPECVDLPINLQVWMKLFALIRSIRASAKSSPPQVF
jgi:hypothetical protein